MTEAETRSEREDRLEWLEAELNRCREENARLQSLLDAFQAGARQADDSNRAEPAGRWSEENFRALFQNMNEGVCLHELLYNDGGAPADYRILEVNPAFEATTGIHRDRALGQKASALYGTGDAPFLDTYARVAETGKAESFEIFWPPMQKHLLISAFSPIKGRFATVFTDITGQKEREEQLRISEEYLSTTLNSIGDAVITTDTRGRIVRMNPVAEELTGWRLPVAVGEPVERVFRIFNEKTRAEVENPVDKVLRTGTIVGLANHTVLMAKDGKERFIDDSGAPIKNDRGDVIGAVLIFRDITAKYTADEAIRQREVKLRSIFRAAPVGIGLVSDRVLMEVNDRICDMTGYLREELVGRSARMLYPSDEEYEFVGREKYRQIAERGTGTVETRFARRDGTLINVLMSSTPLDPDDLSTGVTFTALDITDQKRAQAETRKFRTISDRAVHGNAIADLQGNIVYVNDYFARAHGYAAEEVIGSNLSIFHNDRQMETVRRIQALLMETGQYGPVEVWHTARDGSEFPMLMSIILLEDDSGRSAYLAASAVDISDSVAKRAEHERLTTAIEQTGEIIAITDAGGAIQYTNPAFERITGYAQDEIAGKNPRFLKSGVQDRAFYRNLWGTILSGNRWAGRLVNRRKDGTLYTSECTISPVRDHDDAIVNFVWIGRDISREMAFEKRMAQAQRMEAIGNLAGGIAHDFNNILFPIVGISEMLLEDLPAGSPEHENAGEILGAAGRGRDLVKQILAFSRQSEHKKIPIRPQNILKEVLKLSRSTIPSNIQITQEIQADCGMVMADPTQLHQIAMNLITNAFHASELKGGAIHVQLVETRPETETWEGSAPEPGLYAKLSVSDTGCGIDPAVMDKIFEPYFTTKGQGKGTGLGLAVVYGIVREYRGEIKVASEVGRGTTVSVYLPLMERRTELRPEPEIKRYPTGTERILLVDDEDAIVRLVSRMLDRLGYRVTPFGSSPEALAAFRADPDAFDLVITDMTMPGMTGDQLAGRLIAVRPEVPVIICTGFSERISREKARSMGIKGFLMKPVVKSDMARMVREVLDKTAGLQRQLGKHRADEQSAADRRQ